MQNLLRSSLKTGLTRLKDFQERVDQSFDAALRSDGLPHNTSIHESVSETGGAQASDQAALDIEDFPAFGRSHKEKLVLSDVSEENLSLDSRSPRRSAIALEPETKDESFINAVGASSSAENSVPLPSPPPISAEGVTQEGLVDKNQVNERKITEPKRETGSTEMGLDTIDHASADHIASNKLLINEEDSKTEPLSEQQNFERSPPQSKEILPDSNRQRNNDLGGSVDLPNLHTPHVHVDGGSIDPTEEQLIDVVALRSALPTTSGVDQPTEVTNVTASPPEPVRRQSVLTYSQIVQRNVPPKSSITAPDAASQFPCSMGDSSPAVLVDRLDPVTQQEGTKVGGTSAVKLVSDGKDEPSTQDAKPDSDGNTKSDGGSASKRRPPLESLPNPIDTALISECNTDGSDIEPQSNTGPEMAPGVRNSPIMSATNVLLTDDRGRSQNVGNTDAVPIKTFLEDGTRSSPSPQPTIDAKIRVLPRTPSNQVNSYIEASMETLFSRMQKTALSEQDRQHHLWNSTASFLSKVTTAATNVAEAATSVAVSAAASAAGTVTEVAASAVAAPNGHVVPGPSSAVDVEITSLKKLVKHLENEVEQYKLEGQAVENRRSLADEKARLLRSELQASERALAESQTEVRKLNAKVDQLQTLVAEIKSQQSVAAKVHMEQLESHAAATETARTAAEKRAAMLQDQLQSYVSPDVYKNTVEKLTLLLRTEEDKVRSWEAHVQELENASERYIQQIAELKESADRAKREYEDSCFRSKSTEPESYKKATQEAQVMAPLMQRIAALEKDNSSLQERLRVTSNVEMARSADLQKSLKQFEDKCQFLQCENEALKAEIQSFERRQKELNDKLAASEETIAKSFARTSSSVEHQETVSQLGAKLRNAQLKISRLLREVEEVSSKNTKMDVNKLFQDGKKSISHKATQTTTLVGSFSEMPPPLFRHSSESQVTSDATMSPVTSPINPDRQRQLLRIDYEQIKEENRLLDDECAKLTFELQKQTLEIRQLRERLFALENS